MVVVSCGAGDDSRHERGHSWHTMADTLVLVVHFGILGVLWDPFVRLPFQCWVVYSHATEWFVLIQWEEYVLCGVWLHKKHYTKLACSASLQGREGSSDSVRLPGQCGSTTKWLPFGRPYAALPTRGEKL